VDGAGNHNSGDLVIPANVTLTFLPAYSPELNPQEHIWDEIRENIFKNYAAKSMDEVCDSSWRPRSTSNATPRWSNP
jgi:transposase